MDTFYTYTNTLYMRNCLFLYEQFYSNMCNLNFCVDSKIWKYNAKAGRHAPDMEVKGIPCFWDKHGIIYSLLIDKISNILSFIFPD